MRRILFLPFLFLTACALQAAPVSQITPTVTPLPFNTATLMPTFTPRPSPTTAPPTIAPTIAPITAVLTNQVNVRTEPDKNATSLGLLNYNTKIMVTGRDSSGAWFRIIYSENSQTSGWVSALYVQISAEDIARLPVVQDEVIVSLTQTTPVASTSKETPVQASRNNSATPAAHTASVKVQIFVRKGPGQTYESLGMVNAGTIVTLTGRSQNEVWVQILYEGGSDGRGWVAAAYLTGADLQGLPYFDNQGNLVSGSSQLTDPSQPTLTATAYSPAASDGDSEKKPAVQLKFSPDGTRDFSFSSELSSPTGDTTDWVAFTPYEPTNQSTYIYFKLECSGNGGITATLKKNGLPVQDAKPLLCGNYDLAMKVLGGQEYILVLNADGSGSQLRYTSYTLTLNSAR